MTSSVTIGGKESGRCTSGNYLFAAKSTGWAKVKHQYDMSPHESVPFLQPLQDVQLAEIKGAEKAWSQWLAMEDWMVGPRAPGGLDMHEMQHQAKLLGLE